MPWLLEGYLQKKKLEKKKMRKKTKKKRIEKRKQKRTKKRKTKTRRANKLIFEIFLYSPWEHRLITRLQAKIEMMSSGTAKSWTTFVAISLCRSVVIWFPFERLDLKLDLVLETHGRLLNLSKYAMLPLALLDPDWLKPSRGAWGARINFFWRSGSHETPFLTNSF